MRPSALVYQNSTQHQTDADTGAFVGIVTTAGQFIEAKTIFISDLHWNQELLEVSPSSAELFRNDARLVSLARAMTFSKKNDLQHQPEQPKPTQQPEEPEEQEQQEQQEHLEPGQSQPTQQTSENSVDSQASSSSKLPPTLVTQLHAPSVLFFNSPPAKPSQSAQSSQHTAPIRLVSLNNLTESCPSPYTLTHSTVPLSISPVSAVRPSTPCAQAVLTPALKTLFSKYATHMAPFYSLFYQTQFISSNQGVFPLSVKINAEHTLEVPGVYLMTSPALHDVELDSALIHAEKAFRKNFENAADMPIFFAPRKADGSLDNDSEEVGESKIDEESSSGEKETEPTEAPKQNEDLDSTQQAEPAPSQPVAKIKNEALDKANDVLSALDQDLADLEGLDGLDDL